MHKQKNQKYAQPKPMPNRRNLVLAGTRKPPLRARKILKK